MVRVLGPSREGGGAVVAIPSFHTHKIEKKVVNFLVNFLVNFFIANYYHIGILINVNYVNWDVNYWLTF
jgi:hypothetical protein